MWKEAVGWTITYTLNFVNQSHDVKKEEPPSLQGLLGPGNLGPDVGTSEGVTGCPDSPVLLHSASHEMGAGAVLKLGFCWAWIHCPWRDSPPEQGYAPREGYSR